MSKTPNQIRYEKFTKKHRKEKRWYRPLEYAKPRCTDKRHRKYPVYGWRGIKCDLTYQQAEILYKRDGGENLNQPLLDRINPDGNYTFNNCRYIERVENIKRKRPPGSIKTCNKKTEEEEQWTE